MSLLISDGTLSIVNTVRRLSIISSVVVLLVGIAMMKPVQFSTAMNKFLNLLLCVKGKF